MAEDESKDHEKQTNIAKVSSFKQAFSFIKDSSHYQEIEASSSSSNISLPRQPLNTNCITVNPKQRGNPIIQYITSVPLEYGDIVPDYVLGKTTCALYLRYHNLHPNYIHERLKKLGYAFEMRILLVQVDLKDCQQALNELARIAVMADCTLILAWSSEEAGRYLETYKAYENKPPDLLKEKVDKDYLSKLTDCLTTIKSVNRGDVITLQSTFGSMDNIISASVQDLALCPGIGLQKAKRIHALFREPFLTKHKKIKSENYNTGDS
ncbi:uncharacterized protein TRIADDRAFT_61989 [Trichoplax adhaerens]|uniref:DNA excision repair protein ERCC-1 n=1 Tax=Trichoplax adhaerens TaxID=10228 RepID=B3SCJ1_TRIAD|nr:hypothetical protein TRIADDRAFT_61989 [Trichoplax adhaerens]EDV19526.1 hypothetical protein TRIADDRAFT_61989 [Trichoplax adhaerens]|eukprot:XP_002117958.1 hypothetical protein TRIADDRAFT_61989 [Trichoplax adhaerens]